jgi:hypothetical protein
MKRIDIKGHLFLLALFSPFWISNLLFHLGIGIPEQSLHTETVFAAEEEIINEEIPSLATINYDPADDAIADLSRALGHDVTDETKRRVRYLFEKAEEAHIAPLAMVRTIYCESMWYSIQSGARYPDGTQEQSFGLAQIHLPSHPDVSREEALNAYFAIDWMIAHWDLDIWYGYDRKTQRCTNSIHSYWLEPDNS